MDRSRVEMACLSLLFLVLLVSGQIGAQTSRASRPSLDTSARTKKLVKLLEVRAQRDQATARLVTIGAPAVPPVIRALEDPRPEVVLAAIRTLDAIGHSAKPALPRLLQLVKHDNPCITHAAFHARPGILFEGVTMVVAYNEGCILEFEGGKRVRKIDGLPGIRDAERLANGNYLVAQDVKSPPRVCEITPAGKQVWVYKKVDGPNDVDRLPGGTTLISDLGGGRILEVDAVGKVVWEFKKDIRPAAADRLPNGNTLVVDITTNRAIEIDKAGEIVWQFKGERDRVVDVDRLASGNTLVTMIGRRGVAIEGDRSGVVREMDRKGKTVMEIKGLYQPTDADRLWNGHTLVAQRGAVLEFDADGKEVWRYRVNGYASKVKRY